jgi:hypothetical protein
MLLTACLALTSCNTASDVGDPVLVDGTWTGPIEGLVATVTITLTEDADGIVTGGGTMQTAAGLVPILVQSGAHAFPNLTLNLGSSGLATFTYTARVSSGSITGNVTGSGFTGESLIMRRL